MKYVESNPCMLFIHFRYIHYIERVFCFSILVSSMFIFLLPIQVSLEECQARKLLRCGPKESTAASEGMFFVPWRHMNEQHVQYYTEKKCLCSSVSEKKKKLVL